MRRDCIIGSEELRHELLAAASRGIGPAHYGGQWQETEFAKAQPIIEAELERPGREWGMSMARSLISFLQNVKNT